MKAPAAALIAVALIVAACGGGGDGDSTTAPAEQATAAAAGGVDGTTVPVPEAPGSTTAPQEGASGTVEYAKAAKHSSSDDPDATYPLVSGRYRFAWNTPTDDPCSRVEVALTQVDGDFSYKKPSTSARFNAVVYDVPQGLYKLEQLDPDCSQWDLRIDWMTN